MENVQETLQRVFLGKDRANMGDDARTDGVMFQRMLLCAPEHTVRQLASALMKYTLDTSLLDTEDEKVSKILNILFRGDRIDPDDTRTIVSIMAEFLVQLREHRIEFAANFLKAVSSKIFEEFEESWKTASSNFQENTRTGSRDLSTLHYHSSMLSDLYAFELVAPDELLCTLERVVPLVSGSGLTKTFIYEVMSRALTGSTPKLPASMWKIMQTKWQFLVRENQQIDPSGRTGRAIDAFLKDAQLRKRSCGVPFIIGTSEDLEDMCRSIFADVTRLRVKAKRGSRCV